MYPSFPVPEHFHEGEGKLVIPPPPEDPEDDPEEPPDDPEDPEEPPPLPQEPPDEIVVEPLPTIRSRRRAKTTLLQNRGSQTM